MSPFLRRSKCKEDYSAIVKQIELTANVAKLVDVGVKVHPYLAIEPSHFAKLIDKFQYEECKRAENATDEEKKNFHVLKREAVIESVLRLEVILKAAW